MKTIILSIINSLLLGVLIPSAMESFIMAGYSNHTIFTASTGTIIGTVIAIQKHISKPVYWIGLGIVLVSIAFLYLQQLDSDYIDTEVAYGLLLLLLIFFIGFAYILAFVELLIVKKLKTNTQQVIKQGNIESSEYNIVNDLMKAAHTLQQNKIFWTADEDTRTRQLLDLLPEKYETKDQSKYGKSGKGIKAGSVDGVIKINGIEIFVEAFNLNNLTKSIVKSHLNKLEKNYDSKGLKEKFIVVYYNLRTNTFKEASDKYKDYIENEHKFIYSRVKKIEEITTKYTDSRVFRTYHKREGKEVVLYHLVLMFPKQL